MRKDWKRECFNWASFKTGWYSSGPRRPGRVGKNHFQPQPSWVLRVGVRAGKSSRLVSSSARDQDPALHSRPAVPHGVGVPGPARCGLSHFSALAATWYKACCAVLCCAVLHLGTVGTEGSTYFVQA